MIIEKIIKQLTPERIKKEVALVEAIKLPPKLQKLVKEYEKVGDRDSFIWKWSYKVAQIITFPNVPKIYYNSLYITKFLMILFIVLLDDVADKLQNKILLEEILKIPFNEKGIKLNYLTSKEKKYLKLTKKVWCTLSKTIKVYPSYKRFSSIIEYDINQILNGMNYAYLLNQYLDMSNEMESQIYLSHNTPAILSYMIDLTCLSNFNIKYLGFVRKIGWYTQLMTRISNWVATWEREIAERDYTSGIFIYTNNEFQDIKKIKKLKIEKKLLKQWEQFYNRIKILKSKNKTINIGKILEKIEKLTILHLISKKLI